MTVELKTALPKCNQQLSEHIVNDAPRSFTDTDFPIGTVSHQGDLIFIRLPNLPATAKPRKDRQLTIGNTQGSRHILKIGKVYDCEPAEVIQAISHACHAIHVSPQYVGPVFQTNKGRAFVTHPEHGNQKFNGDMIIGCIYQRNLDAEEREQRTMD